MTTSKWSRTKPSSASSDVYSARLRAVSCGSARRRTRFVDALEDADHLLVELRALREKGAPTEVVEREDGSAAASGTG
jgi:hypothetical protein